MGKLVNEMTDEEYGQYKMRYYESIIHEIALKNIEGIKDGDIRKSADGIFRVKIRGQENYNRFYKALSASPIAKNEGYANSYFIGTFACVYEVHIKIPVQRHEEHTSSMLWSKISAITRKEARAYGAVV